jgi:hypothetical protein
VSAWAELVERLIAAGHPDPLSYTPVQAVAYGELAERRRQREAGDAYTIQRNAAAAAFGSMKAEDEKAFVKALDPDED